MTPEERIIQFVEYLKESGQIRFEKEFFDQTGIVRQHYRRVKLGEIRFTTTQLYEVSRHYNINMNWVFGTEKNMLRYTPKSTLLTPKKQHN